jgi:cytochrome c1
MTNRSLLLWAALAATALQSPPANAKEADQAAPGIERQSWSFGGFRGQYDKAQLQRGFQVYQQICASCHELKRLYFRNLVQQGGPEFPEEAVKTLAAEWPNKITDGPDDAGNMFERPALLSDPILGPFKNDKAARAAFGGALPPDLSLIAKARSVENHSGWAKHVLLDMPKDIVTGYQEGGVDYLYALLTGYSDKVPADLKLAEGMTYNTAFPGNQIAMPAPLGKESFVKYQDGSGSLEDNARDVAAFLAWAADPSLNSRKYIGWQVMVYLLVTTLLMYIGKKRIWSRIKH